MFTNLISPRPREHNERKEDTLVKDQMQSALSATHKAHSMLLTTASEVSSLASEVAVSLKKENQTPTLQCQIIESIILTTYDGEILEYNESAEDLFCRNKGCLKNQNIKRFIPNLESLMEMFDNVKTFTTAAQDCTERGFTISISFNMLSNNILFVIKEFN